MARLLSYLDPTHPMLPEVTRVQSLGRNRGVKSTNNLLESAEAFVERLKARFGPMDKEGVGEE